MGLTEVRAGGSTLACSGRKGSIAARSGCRPAEIWWARVKYGRVASESWIANGYVEMLVGSVGSDLYWLPSMEEYSGVENLEAMEEAINYQRYLSGLIIELASAVGSGGSLLDFGAGVGTYARQARAVGYSVLCVEIDVGLRLRLAKQGFDTVSELAEVPNESQRAVYSF